MEVVRGGGDQHQLEDSWIKTALNPAPLRDQLKLNFTRFNDKLHFYRFDASFRGHASQIVLRTQKNPGVKLTKLYLSPGPDSAK